MSVMDVINEENGNPVNPTNDDANLVPQEVQNAEESVNTLPTDGNVESAPIPQTNYYSPEEMRTLAIEAVDTSRIPPEMLPIYKSMLAPITRKSQELSEQLRAMVQMNQPVQEPPKTIEEAFMRDPQGVVGELNQVIASKVAEANAMMDNDPFTANKLIAEATQLTNRKTDLIMSAQVQSQKIAHEQAVMSQSVSALQSYIPDINSKAPVLLDFAINQMGYTAEEVEYMTNPVKSGQSAVKNVLMFNRLYDAMNASKTIQQKAMPQQATQVASNSVSSGQSSGNRAYDLARQRAIDNPTTDNFADLLAAKRAKKPN